MDGINVHCTKSADEEGQFFSKYIERILRIRPLFDGGIEGMIRQKRDTLEWCILNWW